MWVHEWNIKVIHNWNIHFEMKVWNILVMIFITPPTTIDFPNATFYFWFFGLNNAIVCPFQNYNHQSSSSNLKIN